MSGAGWACFSATATCTRNDVLATGSSYPVLTVTVNVAGNAPGQVTNQVSASGGGSAAANATDLTLIGSYSPCDINQDGVTNVSDVQQIVNEALGVAPAVNDMNHDGKVKVADVQVVINAALGLGCSAS
jgi:hypothetical protein